MPVWTKLVIEPTLSSCRHQCGQHSCLQVPSAHEECAEFPLKKMKGRSDGLKGEPAAFSVYSESLIARGALGKVNPENPPEAALLILHYQ